MALFPTHHTLTQGSLHYRLATLGYQKRNTYGVETFILRCNFFRITILFNGLSREKNIIYNMGSNDLSNDMHRGLIQYPIPYATICTILCDNPYHFIV